MKFRLRDVVWSVTALTVAVAVTCWRQDLGVALIIFFLGIAFIRIGSWTEGRGFTVIGICAMIIALLIAAPPLVTRICWVGRKDVTVTVRVHDLTGNTISQAVVRLTDRHRSGGSTGSTDANGITKVVGQFQSNFSITP